VIQKEQQTRSEAELSESRERSDSGTNNKQQTTNNKQQTTYNKPS